MLQQPRERSDKGSGRKRIPEYDRRGSFCRCDPLRRICCKRKSGDPSKTETGSKNGAKVILVNPEGYEQDHMSFAYKTIETEQQPCVSLRALQRLW